METLTITQSATTYREVAVPDSLEGFQQWHFTSGGTTGPDFKRFARLFRSFVKKAVGPACKLVAFSSGHYILSGFICKGGQFVFFSISDVRHFPGKWASDILVRTAQHDKDYTGGRNTSTTIERFAESVGSLLS